MFIKECLGPVEGRTQDWMEGEVELCCRHDRSLRQPHRGLELKWPIRVVSHQAGRAMPLYLLVNRYGLPLEGWELRPGDCSRGSPQGVDSLSANSSSSPSCPHHHPLQVVLQRMSCKPVCRSLPGQRGFTLPSLFPCFPHKIKSQVTHYPKITYTTGATRPNTETLI